MTGDEALKPFQKHDKYTIVYYCFFSLTVYFGKYVLRLLASTTLVSSHADVVGTLKILSSRRQQ